MAKSVGSAYMDQRSFHPFAINLLFLDLSFINMTPGVPNDLIAALKASGQEFELGAGRWR